MTIGLTEAARRTGFRMKYALAVDVDNSAVDLYARNFPSADARATDVSALFPGDIGAQFTPAERRLAAEVGSVDVLVAGPPCQGHSDLNNHTRRKDPKNALCLRVARAAEVLNPSVMIIENVPTVRLDHGGVLEATTNALLGTGYKVAGRILDLRRVGVPQRRKRYVLVASVIPTIDPGDVLEKVADSMPGHKDRDVRWAIHDLLSNDSCSVFDTPSRISSVNAARMAVLFDENRFDLPNEHRPECHRDGDHSYVSMYGRLRWTRPAQTITTGFGSMGQGRFVHPQRRRTLTPHEAARLQTFPDWFDFSSASRGVMATAIGNAVPPLLMAELGVAILPSIAAARQATNQPVRMRA
jgi:DNA (cytosine-5)-methyltransferase 1